MHDSSIAPDTSQANAARSGDARVLAQALRDSRRDTLTTFDAYVAAIPDLKVPLRPEVNPPLWELGHIGWFQDHWISRNPLRHLGWDANPDAVSADADDALYDSSAVPHDTRWLLKLPGVEETRAQLARQLNRTLLVLEQLCDADPRRLYFHRLVLLHEDMHHEAALYMARNFGVPIRDARWKAPRLPEPRPGLDLPSATLELGGDMVGCFRFDNECGTHREHVARTTVDAQVIRWAEYLIAVDAGAVPVPRYLRREGAQWSQWECGSWQPLDLTEPACHVRADEAKAWCAWAGRRLPTEVEWVHAVRTHPAEFRWGDVWEWTSTPFQPYEGFRRHPYRDYSAPWFDGRPVLRGASYMTQPRMRHIEYRNFFSPSRNDIPAGFRTCA